MCERTKLLAGFGMTDITPHLGSYGNGMERLSTHVKEGDSFKAWCLALTDDDGETVVMVITDLSWGHIEWTNKLRAIVKERFGLEGDRFVLGGTHNHNGPDWYSEASLMPANVAYFEMWTERVIQAVELALNDRKSAQIQIGRTQTQGMTFVRRYWRADGCLYGDVDRFYPKSDAPIVAHEAEADEEIQLVKLVREGDKDILLCNWQSHGNFTGNTKVAGTDWIGPMRRKVEREIPDCHFFYLQGCAGNQNCRSRIKSEYPEKKTVDQVGEEVAEVIIAACGREDIFTPVNAGKVKTTQQVIKAPLHWMDDDETGEWEGELNSISCGDISVVTFPVEMFGTTGMQIKKMTPHEMTLLMGYSCGVHCYCPDKEAAEHLGYEAYPRGIPGTAELIRDTHLSALRAMHDQA